jgi:hypothetical protein
MKGSNRVHLRIALLILLTLAFCLLAPRTVAQPFWSPESPLPTPLPILPKPAAAAHIAHPWPGCTPYADGPARCIRRSAR